jgi:hypothetical protein
MKNVTFSSITALMEEIGRAFAQAFRYGARAIATMSLPQMVAACIGLALIITIVPLALCLFIFFMIVKLAVAAIVVNTRRGHNEE